MSIFLSLAAGCAGGASPAGSPPIAPARPKVLERHGDRRVDDYYWLRERENPEVLAYLKAENAYAEAATAHTRPLQEALYAEFKGRLKETDQGASVSDEPYEYYTRTEAGASYPIYCRRRIPDGPEEVILDANLAAKDQAFYALGAFELSPDQRLLAYGEDLSGDERYRLRIKDLATGGFLPEVLENTADSLAWADDNRTLFYVTRDQESRPHRVWRHVLGQDPRRDELVLDESDESFSVDVSGTRSGAYIFIEIGSQVTTEVRCIPADAPTGNWTLLAARRSNVEYYVDHQEDWFYILTNEDAPNFKLMRAPVSDPVRGRWEEVIPHRPEVLLSEIEAFESFLALEEREGGLSQIRIWTEGQAAPRRIPPAESVYLLELGENREYATDLLRYVYESPLTPRSHYDYRISTSESLLRKRQEIPSGHEPARYRCERLLARAGDGTKVPISLVRRADLDPARPHPVVLYGYGAYGISSEPYFSTSRLSLLDRGVVYAIAHVRGGGELGRAWYEDGKYLQKTHSFDDLIACAEELIAQGRTSPDRLAIEGGSAGGLLVAAAMQRRPELFRAVLADVPFVDVLTTMLDPSIPLTVTEYEEWGNPEDPEYYRCLKSYSPVDNVQDRAYPALLVLAGLNDTRVGYWEPAKWVAKLRAHHQGQRPILLRTELSAGHGGASGRYEQLRELAFEYGFLLDQLGISR